MKHIGEGTFISPDAEILSSHYYIGDECYIGPGVRIAAEPFYLGDYSKIHRGSFVYTQQNVFRGGYVLLGRNAWFGQGCVVDGSGGLRAGDNLGAGIGTQMYTHISNGDVLAGCRFHSARRMDIGDDVWFVGFCLVSPIRAGDKSVAMLGSVVTKDMTSNHVYAGSPAKDMTEVFGPAYDTPCVNDKKVALERLLDEAVADFHATHPGVSMVKPDRSKLVVRINDEPFDAGDEVTYFHLPSRTYTKRRSISELVAMRYMTGYRAKFTPAGDAIRDIHDRFLAEYHAEHGEH